MNISEAQSDFYCSPIFRNCKFSLDVKNFTIENYAEWLINTIFSQVNRIKKLQGWNWLVTLEKRTDGSFVLKFGNEKEPMYEETIPYCDFKGVKASFYLTRHEDGVFALTLPEEL